MVVEDVELIVEDLDVEVDQCWGSVVPPGGDPTASRQRPKRSASAAQAGTVPVALAAFVSRRRCCARSKSSRVS